MERTGHNPIRPYSGAEDLPLPGFYEAITIQANITAYRSGKAGRFVIVSRMPLENMELKRSIANGQDWWSAREGLLGGLERHLLDVEHLMSFRRV